MQQLNLSIFNHAGSDDAVEQQAILMRSLLDTFEREHNIHVEFEVIQWHDGWARLHEMSIHGRGADISEIGSTWLADLVKMNALKSFSPFKMKQIGNENDFISANWKAGVTQNPINNTPIVWGIPWSTDARLIFYRRDYLEKAKIDPTEAFKSIESFDQTIAALKNAGFDLPLSLPMPRSHMHIHQIASWIWAAGGDFMTPDGKQVAFNSPEALQGMRYYFKLGSYIPADYRKIEDNDLTPLFLSGKAALLFSGPWLMGDPGLHPIKDYIGLASIPGGSFIGGSHLVVWKHSIKEEAAILLAGFLSRNSTSHNVFPALGLPAHLPDWDGEPFMQEPYFSAFRHALETGRSLPTANLWGVVEKRLVDIAPMIWDKVFASDTPDVDKALSETIVPLARMLNISLNS